MAFNSLNPNAGMPGFDSNGNPLSYGTGGSTQPAQVLAPQDIQAPTSAPSNSASDYLSQQRDMLSRYQAFAKQAYPQNPLFGNDQFAQNHPRFAGALGNAFLAASMIKPSRTVGEGISNVASGVLGVQQYHRQADMEQQMLPQQMMQQQLMQQLGLQKTMADINEANARTGYYGQEGQWRQSEIAKTNFPHAIGTGKVDDQGHMWQDMMEPASGALSPKPVGWTPPEGYQPTFKNEEKNQRMSTPGGLEGEIMGNLMSSDPALQAMGAAQKKIYMDIAAGKAAASTGGSQGAPHPQQDYDSFVNDQKTNAFKDIEKPETDYGKWFTNKVVANPKDPILNDPGKSQAAFNNEQTQYQSQLTNRNANFANWTQTDARKSIPFDPNKAYSARNSKAPATTTTGKARVNPFAPAPMPQQ